MNIIIHVIIINIFSLLRTRPEINVTNHVIKLKNDYVMNVLIIRINYNDLLSATTAAI